MMTKFRIWRCRRLTRWPNNNRDDFKIWERGNYYALTNYDNILQSSYWFGNKSDQDTSALQKGIRIKNLKKRYHNGKIAVNDLTLDMHEDQITVLLGNNGAGKSTTMSVLSGTFDT